jgi:hypothetical protein
MTPAVRPSTPADAEAIVALLTGAGLHPSIEPQDLLWKYWLPRADFPAPRSYILTDRSGAIAHAALVPGVWLCGSRRLRIIHLIDWAARSGAVGAGAALLKHIAQQADALLAIGGTALTLKMLPSLGFRPAGTVYGYVRALHPLRLLREMAGRGRLRGLYRATRDALRARAAPRARGGDWLARRVTTEQLAEISALLPPPQPGIDVAERSVDLFAHALACPIAPMAVYLVERAGRARGYFLLASVPGQVRIADCWLGSTAPEEWRALLGCAVAEAAQDRRAAEIVGWANDALTAAALEACGFRARVSHTIQLRPAAGAELPAETLRVQMLDSDAAYFHEGRRSDLWT